MTTGDRRSPLCACGHVEASHWDATPGTPLRPCCDVAGLDLCPCSEWRPRSPAPARLRIANALARWLS